MLLLHGSPNSSLQQVRLIEDMCSEYTVYAPDTAGNGDSDALTESEPSLNHYALAMLEFMDALGLEKVQLYGFHTGGAIAAEMAIIAPQRVRNLVIDGILEPDDAFRLELLSTYAKPFPADFDGAYLVRIFQFCRDQFIFFPWYKRSGESRRKRGLSSAADLKGWVQEVLKANETYHLAYNASFAWPATEKLPLLGDNACVIASEGDPVFEGAKELCEQFPRLPFFSMPLFEDPKYRTVRKSLILSRFK